MWLLPSYWAAMQRGCADLRRKSCGKLENKIVFFCMVATWWLRECRTTPTWRLPMGHLWDNRFRLNTHPTHNDLTLPSQHPCEASWRPQEKMWTFSSLREVGDAWWPHTWGGLHAVLPEHAVFMQLICGLYNLGIRMGLLMSRLSSTYTCNHAIRIGSSKWCKSAEMYDLICQSLNCCSLY